MRLPWRVQHWLKYRRYLTRESLVRLRRALVAERRGEVGFQDTLDLTLKSPYSTPLRLRPSSNDIYTFDEIVIERIYEPVLKAIPDAKTVLDLGGNIGLSALFFLGHYPACTVHTIEAGAANFAILARNLQPFLTVNRVTCTHAAAWASDGPVTFMPPAEPGHVNQGAVADGPSTVGETVMGITLPSIMKQVKLDFIDVLKIDIEGGERDLFRHDHSWLSIVKCIAIEFHDDSRRESGFDAVMQQYGFHCTDHGHTVMAVKR